MKQSSNINKKKFFLSKLTNARIHTILLNRKSESKWEEMQIEIFNITEQNLNSIMKMEDPIIITRNQLLADKIIQMTNIVPIIFAQPSFLNNSSTIAITGFHQRALTIELKLKPQFLANEIMKLDLHHSLFILFPINLTHCLNKQFLLELKQNLPSIPNIIILPSLNSKIIAIESNPWLAPISSCNFFIPLKRIVISMIKDNTIWEINGNLPVKALEKLGIQSSHINRLALIQRQKSYTTSYMLKALKPDYLEVEGLPEEGNYYIAYPHPSSQIELFRQKIFKMETSYKGIIVFMTTDLLKTYLKSEIEILKRAIESYSKINITIVSDFFLNLTTSYKLTTCNFCLTRW